MKSLFSQFQNYKKKISTNDLPEEYQPIPIEKIKLCCLSYCIDAGMSPLPAFSGCDDFEPKSELTFRKGLSNAASTYRQGIPS